MAEASLFVHNLDKDTLAANTDLMLSHVNVGTGSDVTIKELAQTIKEVVKFRGNLRFDTTKPDGAPRKLLDVSLLTTLGWAARTPLTRGLEQSYADFKSNI